MAKVVNLFAGPDGGKTTISAGVFYSLKIMDYNVEFVQEFAKELVFDNRTNVLESDQLFILANQNRNLMIKAFESNLDYVIMESPILLSNIYFNELSIYNKELFEQFTLDIFNKYDNINFYLQRNPNSKFNEVGRRHSEYESKMLDFDILRYLNQNEIQFYNLDVNENTVENIVGILTKRNT